MTEITPEAMQQSSEYAQELVQQGFRPNEVDIQAMLAQMQKLQSTVDALNAERGVPVDPVDGHRKHLWGHLNLRDMARPDVDVSEVKKLLSALPEVSDHITPAETEALHFAVEQLLKAHPGKELEYLGVLSAELHQMVLNREGKSGATHVRITALENESGATHDRITALENELAAMKERISNLHAEVHVTEPSNG